VIGLLLRQGRANYEKGERMCRTCRLVYTEDEERCHYCGYTLAYTPHTGVRWVRCSKCGHTYSYRPRRGVKWVECSKCGHPSLIGRAGGDMVELAAEV
jgi:Zn ribbon nucleic-acid-binding protein